MKKQMGFTLMEMIGVIAVIAILASVATPKIFEAIRDAKVASFLEDVNTIRASVATYYKDTGTFPDHDVTASSGDKHTLLKDTSAGVAGWRGPYIDKDLNNPFSPAAVRRVVTSSGDNYQFDLDGDGTADTRSVSYVEVQGLTRIEAQELSNSIDTDAAVTSGSDAWYSAGRVKVVAGTAPTDDNVSMLIYLQKY